MDAKWARVWFGATALCVFAGLVIQLFVTGHAHDGVFRDTTSRVLNVFCFFTVQSNLLVGATTLLLALRLQRRGPAFDVLRLMGLVGITITGIVYHVALAKLLDLESWALAADQLLHTVVPILAVIGWLISGPRGLISARTARLSLLFPLCWFAFTLIRAPFASHFYPYPFVDVKALGYPRVFVNAAWIGLLFFGVAAGAAAIDKLIGSRPATPDGSPQPVV